MNATAFDEHVKKLEDKVSELDEEMKDLSEEKKEEYKEAREEFINRLQAWKDMTAAEFDSFKDNIDEGFHELESVWYRLKKKL